MSTEEKLMKEVEQCREKLVEIIENYDCYLTITDGILFVEKQIGNSVKSVDIHEILL